MLVPSDDMETLKKAFASAGVEMPDLATVEYATSPSGAELVSEEPVKPVGLQNSGLVETQGEVLVPHVTREELERNEPSRGKKMVAIKPPTGISTHAFYLLLSNAYALYLLNGAYDNDSLQQRTGLAPGIISKCLSSPEFKRALALRGVEPSASGLTSEQDYVLLALTDPSDGKTFQQKLRALGISYAKYMAWMKQPAFKAQIDRMTENILQDNTASLVQLERLAGEGDIRAIEYKHKLNGLYDPNKQNNIDIMALMSLLFEVVSRHAPRESLAPISKELGEIAQQLKLGPRQIGQ